MQAQEKPIQVCLWRKGPQCLWDTGGQLQGPHRCGGKKGSWGLSCEGDNSPAAASLHLVVPSCRDSLQPGATPDGFCQAPTAPSCLWCATLVCGNRVKVFGDQQSNSSATRASGNIFLRFLCVCVQRPVGTKAAYLRGPKETERWDMWKEISWDRRH